MGKLGERKEKKSMVKEKVTLNNETGLHARPASELAKMAMKYNCEINLIVNDKKINVKSPLSIMSAGIKENTEIEIICDGENENQALKEITEAFENNFGE